MLFVEGFVDFTMVSSYLMMAVITETQPIINEDGEEECSVPAYILLAGAFVIKWAVKKVIKIIEYRKERNIVRNNGNVITFNPTENEFELAVL